MKDHHSGGKRDIIVQVNTQIRTFYNLSILHILRLKSTNWYNTEFGTQHRCTDSTWERNHYFKKNYQTFARTWKLGCIFRNYPYRVKWNFLFFNSKFWFQSINNQLLIAWVIFIDVYEIVWIKFNGTPFLWIIIKSIFASEGYYLSWDK